jgi:hypothetical protein
MVEQLNPFADVRCGVYPAGIHTQAQSFDAIDVVLAQPMKWERGAEDVARA